MASSVDAEMELDCLRDGRAHCVFLEKVNKYATQEERLSVG